jgi:hypothetical protein
MVPEQVWDSHFCSYGCVFSVLFVCSVFSSLVLSMAADWGSDNLTVFFSLWEWRFLYSYERYYIRPRSWIFLEYFEYELWTLRTTLITLGGLFLFLAFLVLGFRVHKLPNFLSVPWFKVQCDCEESSFHLHFVLVLYFCCMSILCTWIPHICNMKNWSSCV